MKKLTLLLVVLSLLSCQPKEQGNPYLTSGEGFASVEGGKVWYGIMGEGDKAPYLYLHGGPGGTGRGGLLYTAVLEDRPVITMDQLGGGLSTNHQDTSLLKVENFVEQVKAVRDALGLKEFYLTGHSWGTALALEYYSAYPEGVKGIAFNSPYFSTSTWIEDTDALISTLPDSTQRAIKIAEETYAFETDSYLAAMEVFSKNFLRRSDQPFAKPSYQLINPAYDTMEVKGSSFIYNYMWGPSEFSPTGTLLKYENIDALKDVKVPVLFTTGEYDEARPSTVKKFQQLVANSQFVEVPNAGHGTLIDNREVIISALRDFANRVDSADR